MVGEFGCHNKTPHDVTLAWMEDCLANWQRADWGWALWNFRGSFGFSTANARMFSTRSSKGINSIGRCSICCNGIEEPRTSQSRERISYKNDAEDLSNPLPYLTLTTLGLSGMCSGLSQISR